MKTFLRILAGIPFALVCLLVIPVVLPIYILYTFLNLLFAITDYALEGEWHWEENGIDF